MEDYLAGNKGSQGQAPATPAPSGLGGAFGSATSAPAFGAPAPTGGLFGSAPANPAPAPTGGLFGSAPTPAFGSGAPAPAAPAGGGAFGAPAPGSLFGQAPAPAQQGGFGFGSTAPAPANTFGAKPGSLFGGAPTPAPSTGLFGAAPAPPPAASGGFFGASAPAPSLFGTSAPAPATSGLFGTPAPAPTTSFFGAQAAPTPAPGTSLFGASAPAGGGMFSSTPAPTPGGLFGSAPAPSTGGLFGSQAPAPQSGLFGAPAPAPTPGGLFGSTPAPATAGTLFGSPPPASVSAAPPAVPPPSAEAILAQQMAAMENQRKELEMLNAWRSKPPSGSKVVPKSIYDSSTGRNWNGGGSSYASSSSALVSYQAAPRSSAKIRPRGYTPSKSSHIATLGRKNGGSPILSPNRFIGSSTKALFIKPNSMTPKPKMRLRLTNDVSESKTDSGVANLENGYYNSPSPNKLNATSPGLRSDEVSIRSPSPSKGTFSKPVDSASPLISRASESPSMNGHKHSPGYDLYKQVVGSLDIGAESPNVASPLPAAKNCVPKLSKPGYVVHPSISDLEAMSEADLAAVEDFKVERPGFGSVTWDGAVDVRGVDLDSVVVIEKKNVSVYDNAELNAGKPKQGSKLNRSAVITLYDIFPKNGQSSSIEAKNKMARRIEKATVKMGAELLLYDAENGIWQFRVGHFSRYGLDDDSDDDSEDEVLEIPSSGPGHGQHRHHQLIETDLGEDSGVSNFRAPHDEDESTSANTNDDREIVDDNEVENEMDDNAIVLAGEEAYTQMTEEMMRRGGDDGEISPYYPTAEMDEQVPFPNEAAVTPTAVCRKSFLSATNISLPPMEHSICGKLAADSGIAIATSSSVDHGLRMRRSFRVGWKPDGTFIHIKKNTQDGSVLKQSKPVLAVTDEKASSRKLDQSHALMETHKKHSIIMKETESKIPLFTLPRKCSDSYSSANTMLKEFSDSSTMCLFEPSTQHSVSSTFSLLSTLYGSDEVTNEEMNESRRVESLSILLKRINSDDTALAVSSAQFSGDIYGSIFAALSGGDNAKASSIALESGNPRLSLMIASSFPQARSYADAQLDCWHQSGAETHVPTGILRIFFLMSGSMSVEDQMFKSNKSSYGINWMRNFGMRLKSRCNMERSISSFVNQYNACISSGLAPSPKPLYVDNVSFNESRDTNNCTMYQVLNHYANHDRDLYEIIAPPGHTIFRHDYSASFHLSSALVSISDATMGFYKDTLVVDSVSSQLVTMGSWEWAVYATLCVIGGQKVSEPFAHARSLQAKNIIMRNFSPSTDPLANQRREFLENMGIPSVWFHEACAYRCANEGDVVGYVDNIKRVSLQDALMTLEAAIIPAMLLESPEKTLELLDAFNSLITGESQNHWEKPNGCGTIHRFLILCKRVEALSKVALSDISTYRDEIYELNDNASSLADAISNITIPAPCLIMKTDFMLKMSPRDFLFSEAERTLSLLRMKLHALQKNRGCATDAPTLNNCASQLAFDLSCDGMFGTSIVPTGDSSILRGRCGFKI